MPIIQILPNGGKTYTPSPAPTREQPKRGKCKGWTRNTVRRNIDFLQSVRDDELDGTGYALSLTVRDCPETPADWEKVRYRFVKRLARMGMIRLHWLTEWQRRGCPHIHAAVWFDTAIDTDTVISHWLACTTAYRSSRRSQDAKPHSNVVGWFEYLGKHAGRSVKNYQRQNANIPQAWSGVTGRMWGHSGEWPLSEAKTVDATHAVWVQYRRLMLRYQIGKARRQKDLRRLRYFKRYRARAAVETSRAQALPRLWIPEEDQWRLLAAACASASRNA